MGTTFLIVSIAGLALTVNAWWPARAVWLTGFVFFAGWLVGELAPLLLLLHIAGVVAFIAAGALHTPTGWAGLGVSALAAGGLARIVIESIRVFVVLDSALRDGLSTEQLAVSERGPIPWAKLLLPLWLWSRGVKRHRGIPYADKGWRNKLDVYTGRDAPPNAPVLLYVHGGGWSPVSNKNHQGKPLLLHMAARGWVCVSTNYRVSPKVAFPEHLIDVKRALAWVRANITAHGGDPSFVAVTGGSAGGHLSALMALTQNYPEYQPGFEEADTSVQACAPHYGVYDFTPDSGTKLAIARMRFLERIVMKRTIAAHRAEFEKASPHFRVHDDAPPFFVVHGTNDSLAPVAEARAFVARLREVSRAPVVYAELPRTQHAFDVFHSIRSDCTARAVERFLNAVRTADERERSPD